jgi:hypothetical protein
MTGSRSGSLRIDLLAPGYPVLYGRYLQFLLASLFPLGGPLLRIQPIRLGGIVLVWNVDSNGIIR